MSAEKNNDTNLSMRWDLDAIFPGGSESVEFKSFRDKLKADLAAASKVLDGLPRKLDSSSIEAYKDAILEFQRLVGEVYLTYSMGDCLTSQNVDDKPALQIMQEADVYVSGSKNLQTRLGSFFRDLSDDEWKQLLEHKELAPIAFPLNEMREEAKKKMPVEFETLANELAVNGYHAWNRLYDKMAGDLRVDFEVNGKKSTISLGQLASKFDHAERPVRMQAFEKLEEAWESRADYAAMALNSIAGYRLSLYHNRKWESPLYEPLTMGRMKEETLKAMWKAVSDGLAGLKPYVDAKKKLLGLDSFHWCDQTAPVGSADDTMSWDDGREFILKHLAGFSDEMAEFSKMAFEKRWIEAENRPGKAGGGYCTGFGPRKQSRIFMTYINTYGDMMTLAHELGHAFHSWVLNDLPELARDYPMNLAETASTFNELLVTDAALTESKDDAQRMMLLEQKLQRALVLFCNIHARYLFDVKFYAERKNGVVPRQRLDEMMVEAQKEAFGGLIDGDGYHKLFWASKLHFFLSDQPFYNFPYTFGFLFSGGIYDLAKKGGKEFFPKYRDLLHDTGRMKTEDLAMKHLGVDLTKPDFWNAAVARMIEDVEPFIKLAEKLG